MKKRMLVVFGMLIAGVSGFAQNPFFSEYTSPALQTILHQVADNHTITTVDCAAFNGNQYDSNYLTYKGLLEKATVPELVMLLHHPYSNIRANAFLILSETTDIDIFPILLSLFKDTACIYAKSNCMVSSRYTHCLTNFDFFFEISTTQYYPEAKKLNVFETDFIDSMVIFNKHQSIVALNIALRRSKPIEHRYDRVKALWLEQHNQTALLALARYQKESDLINFFRCDNYGHYEYLYPTIEAFPHDTFFSILQQEAIKFKFRFFEEEKFYRALSAYKSDRSAKVLAVCLSRLNELSDLSEQYRRKKNMLYAISDHLDSNYVSLLFSLWDDGLFTPQTISYLKSTAPQMALDKSIKVLDRFEVVRLYPYGLYIFSLDTSINLMLDIIFEHDSSLSIKLLSKIITTSTNLMAQNLIKRAVKIGSEAFIEPLFTMLQSDGYNIAIPNATQALINYNKSSVNKRLLVISQTKKDKYWAKKMNEVLKQNGIQ